MAFEILSARYDNPEKTSFTAMLKEVEHGFEFPFGYIIAGDDDAPLSVFVREKYMAGELQVENYIPPVIPDEVLAAQIRSERNKRLAATDFLVNPDYPLSDAARAVVVQYRRDLRDITAQVGFPKNVTWPEMPEI